MRIRRIPLVITLSLAATGVVAAGVTDVAVGHTAQQRIVQAATCRLHPTGPVTAQLTDTLAGLQVLTGKLGTVHITADGVHRGGTDMNVNAVLYNVTTHGATDGGTVTATIPYNALQQRLGSAAAFMTVGTDGTGLTLTGTVGNLGLPVTVDTSISTTANSLTITPTSVVLLGQAIPVSALSSIPGGSSMAGSLKPHTVTLPGLPAGARLTSARPDSTGLSIQLSIPHTNSLSKATGAGSAGAGCSSAKT
ncbi:hypothetical protein ABIA33_000717 [Streptacidiphilus sp. MAP12-16]|uniref:LmeA family phospholipid-binding protein n=1 Tax=Streptacidiphilus sp. MAP12-16 TaxID=3156300 RepID=UPI0035168EAC